MKKIKIICILLLIFIFSGCTNLENNVENTDKVDDEMLKPTLVSAKVLNERSNFGECELLKAAPEKAKKAIPYALSDENDYYLYFNFGDELCVTEISLQSSSYNVFGIKVGDELKSVGDILAKEEYIVSQENENFKWNVPGIVYSKDRINISFYTDSSEDNALITGIVVKTSDPQYAGITY